MKPVEQPEGTKQSGQAACATLLGVSLEEAIELAGKEGQMSTQDVVSVLARFSQIATSKRRKPSRGELPENCFVYARDGSNPRIGHWMLQWRGRLYDPAESWKTNDWVVTSYLTLEERSL